MLNKPIAPLYKLETETKSTLLLELTQMVQAAIILTSGGGLGMDLAA